MAAAVRKVVKLSATARTAHGTHACRALRGSGVVPSVIHGRRRDDEMLIQIAHKDIAQVVRLPWFWNTVYDIDVEGKGVFRVIPRCFQRHRMFYQNTVSVTFMTFTPFTRHRVRVPVILENTDSCFGVKRGGKMKVTQDYLNCWWAGDHNIPQQILVDTRHMDIGDVVHSNNCGLPDGLVPDKAYHQFPFVSVTGGQSMESLAATEAKAKAK
ncbi:unnamed protein product (mitochondrion) [Plasmodiophora brassicae]|uniref:Uncharacterized protein n=1 Tax=Plasmodiophora brassicae TaxID=37360 RepID=A0A0G4IP74_PLABS|nr:hypothetical protein PBRA_005573 [Plasmodiophora brassicae]SPR01923.1 unnamed protein product [Plasmodiophora brassicae]